MPLEIPDYAVLCGRVEALLEGFFSAEDAKMRAYYEDKLHGWLVARQEYSAQFMEEVQKFAGYCAQQQQLDLKKIGETVTQSTDSDNSALAKGSE